MLDGFFVGHCEFSAYWERHFVFGIWTVKLHNTQQVVIHGRCFLGIFFASTFKAATSFFHPFLKARIAVGFATVFANSWIQI